MRIRPIGVAAAALAACAIAAPASAEGELTYGELTNCAAFVLLEGQAYDSDKASTEDKAKAETFYQQAGALIVTASVLADKDTKVVTEEVKGLNSNMIDALGQDGFADKLIADNKDHCNALGQAALEVITKESK